MEQIIPIASHSTVEQNIPIVPESTAEQSIPLASQSTAEQNNLVIMPQDSSIIPAAIEDVPMFFTPEVPCISPTVSNIPIIPMDSNTDHETGIIEEPLLIDKNIGNVTTSSNSPAGPDSSEVQVTEIGNNILSHPDVAKVKKQVMKSFEKSIDQILRKTLKPSLFTDKTQVNFF